MQITLNIQTQNMHITCNQCGKTVKIDGARLMDAAKLKSAALAIMGAHWIEHNLCTHLSAAFDMGSMQFTIKG